MAVDTETVVQLKSSLLGGVPEKKPLVEIATNKMAPEEIAVHVK